MELAVIDELFAIDHPDEAAFLACDTDRRFDPAQVYQGFDGADHDCCEPRRPVIQQEHCENMKDAIYALLDEFPHGTRCRLCTANDREGMIEEVAAKLWEHRRHGTLDDRPWQEAGPMWQSVFREFAGTAVNVIRAGRHS